MHGKVSLVTMGIPPTIEAANLGMADSLILMVMALVVFGPRRLPEIGRQIGKLMYEFRKASNDFKFQMEEELRSAEEADRRKKEEERINALAATTAPPQLTAPEPTAPPTTDATITDAAILATAETAYPDDGVYPPAAAAPPETPADAAYPRIQPPSTGEQVPAARPNSLTALAKAANGDQASPAEDPEPGSQNAAASAEDDPNGNPGPSPATADVAGVPTVEPGRSEEQPKSEAEQAANHA
jgi:sec-independent protein translocase protein TatB